MSDRPTKTELRKRAVEVKKAVGFVTFWLTEAQSIVEYDSEERGGTRYVTRRSDRPTYTALECLQKAADWQRVLPLRQKRFLDYAERYTRMKQAQMEGD